MRRTIYVISCHCINSVCIAVFESLCNTLSLVKSVVGSEFVAAASVSASVVCRGGHYASSRVRPLVTCQYIVCSGLSDHN